MKELLREEEEKTRTSASKNTGSLHYPQQGIIKILHYIANLVTTYVSTIS